MRYLRSYLPTFHLLDTLNEYHNHVDMEIIDEPDIIVPADKVTDATVKALKQSR